jgi:hypothetical protein
MINPIASLALADAMRDERRPPPLRRHRTARSPLRARLAAALSPRVDAYRSHGAFFVV